jgi:acyl-CoA reductase-like NAD-dependent aldehyde dehydrogenase
MPAPAAVATGLLIGGSVEAGPPMPVHNPAHPTEIAGFATAASAADVDHAIEAAHRALPAWSALSYRERGEFLRHGADSLVAGGDERARLLVRENGKILREAELELQRFRARLTGVAALAAELSEVDVHDGPPLHTTVQYVPRGVAVLVVPWNWPLSILGACLPHALLAGATVVVKPPPTAPLATMESLSALSAVLPPGVLNAVTGRTEDIGLALLTHPHVGHIGFTGSVEAGRRIAGVAGQHLKHVTLELGGNDAALFLADADLEEQAVGRLMTGAFLSAGQVCTAIKRLYVHRSRYDEVVDALTATLRRTVVGDGLDPRATMGPLHTSAGRDRLRELLRSCGGEVRELGELLDDGADGWFARPSLVLSPDPACALVWEEQFGPALPIIPFDTEDEAVDRANATEYGLASSVWSADQDRALAVARRLRAGTTFLNAHGPTVQDDRAPFGGVGSSGLGCELGVAGVREVQVPHTVTSPGVAR